MMQNPALPNPWNYSLGLIGSLCELRGSGRSHRRYRTNPDGRCRPATRRSVGRTHRFFRHLQPIIEEERQLCEGRSSPAKTRFSDQGRTVTQDAVIKQLRTPFQKMPMFSDAQVSDNQAGQIAAYMASLASPSGVSFTLGFQQLAGMIPSVVGNPLENEHSAANGDALQVTTSGMMVWRKTDNWTAFTDGSRTWINGPQGLQTRSNDDRFDWEKAQ